jgi:phosphate uptake regulator
MYRDIFSNLTVIDYLERIAKHIGKSIAYIESVEKVTPTIDGVKNSKPEFYKIDKNKPIIYTIRKG